MSTIIFVFYFCILIGFTALLDSFVYQESFWHALFRLVTYTEHRAAICFTLVIGLFWSGVADWRMRKREKSV